MNMSINGIKNYNYNNYNGDWGLGIGDWAQSPIPNPQSPILYLITLIILKK